MTVQNDHDDGTLVLTGGRHLASRTSANPLISRGRMDIANGCFDSYLEHTQRGRELLNEGEYDGALAEFGEAIRIRPDYWLAYWCRGQARHSNEEYDEAVKDFDEAICRKPCDERVLVDRADVFRDKEDYISTIKDLDEAIRINPQAAMYHVKRGVAWLRLDDAISDAGLNADYHKAFRLKSATLIDPAFPYDDVVEEFCKAQSDGDADKGNRLFDAIEAASFTPRDRALADFDQAVDLDPGCAIAYFERGQIKFKAEEAIKDFDQAIRLEPTNAQFYLRRGEVRFNCGLKTRHFGTAIDDFDQAIRLGPKCADAYDKRGRTWFWSGQYDNAIADFSEAIRLEPWRWTFFSGRRRAWSKTGDYEKAIKDFGTVIRRRLQIPIRIR